MKIQAQSSISGNGNSSSSHYRINSGAGACEPAVPKKPIATKYLDKELPPLESLCEYRVYRLREKLNRGERMSRAEKDWLCREVNNTRDFCTALLVMGYRFDFSDVLKKYVVNQYGSWQAYYAPDRTSIRKHLYGRIYQIVEVPERKSR